MKSYHTKFLSSLSDTPTTVVNMPAYHSSISNQNCQIIGNVPLLPLKTTCKSRGVKGVAPFCNDNAFDIVDESLDLFKANILFSTYEIKDKSDLLLVYNILYIQLCLQKLAKISNQEEAERAVFTQALKQFALPGDANFPLNAFFHKPKNASEGTELRNYLTQMRQEVGSRLVEKVFGMSLDGKPSKWWICFARNSRKFLKTQLTE